MLQNLIQKLNSEDFVVFFNYRNLILGPWDLTRTKCIHIMYRLAILWRHIVENVMNNEVL